VTQTPPPSVKQWASDPIVDQLMKMNANVNRIANALENLNANVMELVEEPKEERKEDA
jgi:regulator of replication initiation timing